MKYRLCRPNTLSDDLTATVAVAGQPLAVWPAAIAVTFISYGVSRDLPYIDTILLLSVRLPNIDSQRANINFLISSFMLEGNSQRLIYQEQVLTIFLSAP
jgi:hypothetical protein